MTDFHYSNRTLPSIAKLTGLTEKDCASILERLTKQGLVLTCDSVPPTTYLVKENK